MQFYTALNNILNFHLYSSKIVKMLKVASRKDVIKMSVTFEKINIYCVSQLEIKV